MHITLSFPFLLDTYLLYLHFRYLIYLHFRSLLWNHLMQRNYEACRILLQYFFPISYCPHSQIANMVKIVSGWQGLGVGVGDGIRTDFLSPVCSCFAWSKWSIFLKCWLTKENFSPTEFSGSLWGEIYVCVFFHDGL